VAWGLSRTTSRKAAYSPGDITGGRPVFAIALLPLSQYEGIIIYFFYTLLVKLYGPDTWETGVRGHG
jgi:hypothetical protein